MYCGGEDTAENSKIEDKAGKEDTNEKEKCFGDSVVNSIDSEHSDTCDCSGSRRASFTDKSGRTAAMLMCRYRSE